MRKSSALLRFLLLPLMLWTLSCCALADERVVLQLKWLHQFQFAGYYAALEQGYFAEEGLDVELRERDPARDVIEQVMQGEAHYGVSDSLLLLRHARGTPVVMVSAIMQHSANAIMTLTESGLVSPRDLNGRRLAFYDSHDDGIDIVAMLAEFGVPRDHLVRSDLRERLDALRSQEVDAVSIYVTNEPFLFREEGIGVHVISPRHYGFDFYGDILFTSPTEADAHPWRVKAMRRAVLRGWHYALDNKAEMVDLILERYNTQGKSRDALMNEARGLDDLISRHTTQLGHIDSGRLDHILTQLHRLGVLSATHSSSSSKSLFPRREFTSLALTAEERAFLEQLGPVRVGLQQQGWPPFEIPGRDGHFEGIALDYLALLQEMLGIQFETVAKPSRSLLHSLRGRHIDLLPAITSTPERRGYMHITTPYARSPMVIITRDDVDFIPALDRLSGQSIGVVDGFTPDELLSRYYPKLGLTRFSSTQEGLQAVSRGQIHAFIDNLSVVNQLIPGLGLSNLKISGQTPYSFDLALGVRNDWPLLHSALDKALAAIPVAQREEIYARWVHLEADGPFSLKRLLPALVLVLLAFFLMTLYVMRLRSFNRNIQAINQQLAQAEQELQDKNRELLELSITDKLTGVFNRHHLDAVLTENHERARRYGLPLSLILFDLDRFKRVNDDHGHQAGDAVLKRFCELVRDNVRASDIFGRWGGEEFLLLCPETSQQDALALANKIRLLCAETRFDHGGYCTVSAGVASAQAGVSLHDFVRAADHALYAAKQAGRNRVMAAGPEENPS